MSSPLKVVNEPEHPALNGQYAAGEDQHINYFKAERTPWLAVDIYLTLRCRLSCTHCMTNSHPNRRETTQHDRLVGLIRELKALGKTRYVCLFGGEPMLVPDLLRAGIDETNACGMLPSVVTSGDWATSEAAAKEGAKMLKGVSALLVSTDRPHLRFVDMATVLRAVEATVNAGINTSICYTAMPGEFGVPDGLPAELREGAKRLNVGIVVTPLSDGGRAAGRQHLIPAVSPEGGCGMMDTPVFDPDGRAFACCPGWSIPREGSSPYLLGKYPEDSVAEMFRRRYQSPILNTLRTDGPMALLRQAARGDVAREAELRDTPPRTPCGACQMLARWNDSPKLYWERR